MTTHRGRQGRLRPKDVSHTWPNDRIDDPVYEALRQLALNLRDVIRVRQVRGSGTVSSFANELGINPGPIQNFLNGTAIIDTFTLAGIETDIGITLWPRHQRLGYDQLW
jgi:hypothetical protein